MKFYLKRLFKSPINGVEVHAILSDFSHNESPKFFHGYVIISEYDDFWIKGENDSFLFEYTDQPNMVHFSNEHDRHDFIMEKVKELFNFEFVENEEE